MKVIIIDSKNEVIEEWNHIMSVEVLGRKLRLITYHTEPAHFDMYIQGYRYQIMPEYKEK